MPQQIQYEDLPPSHKNAHRTGADMGEGPRKPLLRCPRLKVEFRFAYIPFGYMYISLVSLFMLDAVVLWETPEAWLCIVINSGPALGEEGVYIQKGRRRTAILKIIENYRSIPFDHFRIKREDRLKRRRDHAESEHKVFRIFMSILCNTSTDHSFLQHHDIGKYNDTLDNITSRGVARLQIQLAKSWTVLRFL